MTLSSVIKASADVRQQSIVHLHAHVRDHTATTDPVVAALEHELAAAKAALAEAKQQAKAIDADWQARFDTALIAEKASIEAAFRRDDAARIALLAKAAADSIQTLNTGFLKPAEDVGIALAHRALGRFGVERATDVAFLTAVVQSEIARIGESMIVAVLVAADDVTDDAAIDALRTQLPPASRIEVAPHIPSGTVRLQLRLGHIDIDPVRGVTQICAALIDECPS